MIKEPKGHVMVSNTILYNQNVVMHWKQECVVRERFEFITDLKYRRRRKDGNFPAPGREELE
ncbi:hypothetical protein [Methanospirillum hungatei]|uniref:hypothetical protein n=1 Tax=Methanospirillum hungatei TaxID=2203 RepID=UPI0026EC0D3F|nr:hypothetical protein [Methanospirillum hungatei]MCA1917662.1 hypothetical protein [Methanospirillum hungatei]